MKTLIASLAWLLCVVSMILAVVWLIVHRAGSRPDEPFVATLTGFAVVVMLALGGAVVFDSIRG